jgi:hypothetical protein
VDDHQEIGKEAVGIHGKGWVNLGMDQNSVQT